MPRKLSLRVRLGIAFQLYVPTRTHSIIGARWEEIDMTERRWTIAVERLKLRKNDAGKAKPFVVPLPGTAVAILERLRAEAGKSPWVLASPKRPNKHIGAKVLVRALARLQDGERLDLAERLTVHDLRRTWRSLAMDLGVDHAVARLSLGHAGLEGVEGVYGRAQMVGQRAQAAELVADALDRIRLGKAAQVVPMRDPGR
jgi:integrase